MQELVDYLNKLATLSSGLQEHLLSTLRSRTLSKGAFLLKAGHVCQHIYFIQRGLLRCFYVKNDMEVCSWFMKEGDVVISLESFYRQLPSYESLRAMEETVVYYISYNELEQIYRDFPEFNLHGRVITQYYHLHWVSQLYSIRRHNAEEKYNWLLDHQPELAQRVPGKYLATYLDITEFTLSKIRARH